MNRSTAREIVMHCAYSIGFSRKTPQELLAERLTPEAFAAWADEYEVYREFPEKDQCDYIRETVIGVAEHGPELDMYISRYARGWSFARIPLIAAAIMRVAMYEILYMPDIPNAAAINDAVELSKKYEDEKVVSFVNGLLGAFVRAEFPDTPPAPEKKPAAETEA